MTAFPKLPDALSPTADEPLARVRSYTSGFADELGDRQLVFDHATATSLEVLRLKKAFSDSPEFEAALRARVEETRHLQHPSLATIHGVERRGEDGLCLISKLTSGRRVSELVSKAHGAAFALELIRLVTPALAMLQRTGPGVAHGALSPERIVATRDGRLVVVEHVLGSAIEALKLTRPQLAGLGLVVPVGTDPVRLDSRTDLTQLGFIALSLLVGRQLDAADYPDRIPALLDEFVLGAGSPILSAKLRAWLERAMQISPRSFATARDAQDALGQLPDDVDVRIAEATGLLPEVRAEAAATPKPPVRVRHESVPANGAEPHPAAGTADLFAPPQPVGGSGRPAAAWITAALAVLAAFEAVAIAVLLYTRPPADATENRGPAVDVAGAPDAASMPPVTSSGQAATSLSGLGGVDAVPPKTDSAPSVPAVPAPPVAADPRPGGIAVSSAIDLQVFRNGTLVGSTTDGPIAVNAGSQTLEFVNETLGFRIRQTVNVKSGKVTPVSVALPNGRISINAVPWAEVTIDGNPAGETPLANLSLPIGTHEIVFRHPQLGERKQTVVVTVDGLVRVTQTFQPGLEH